jgi:UDP-N-acetyl-D-mannosaminuronate dehydrogenase
VLVHDPCVRVWEEFPSVPVSQDLSKCLALSDGVVFAVPHSEYREITAPEIVAERLSFVVDAQNIINDSMADQLWQAGCKVLGVGKGHWRKRGYQWLPQQREAA